jgi:hypothetical protein
MFAPKFSYIVFLPVEGLVPLPNYLPRWGPPPAVYMLRTAGGRVFWTEYYPERSEKTPQKTTIPSIRGPYIVHISLIFNKI